VDPFEYLTLARDGDAWIGRAPADAEGVLFGGLVISQAIAAVTRDALAEGRRLHSVHLYFLRPVLASSPVSYVVRPLRDGRSFSSRRLEATQDGKPTLDLTCSFTEDTDGYVYDVPPAGGGELPPLGEVEDGPPGWEASWLGPTERRADGTYESTHRKWCRARAPLPDDPGLHAALLGFATDWTGIGGRPLHLDGDTTGMVSLDHAIWFHRPARADDWHLFDVHSLVNAGGRGLLRGVLRDVDGRVVASMAQEMRLTVI
jgi:acyl-CoA thioesterase-2